jgi:hypothetical protein
MLHRRKSAGRMDRHNRDHRMGHDTVGSGGCIGEDVTQSSKIIVALHFLVGFAVHSLASAL